MRNGSGIDIHSLAKHSTYVGEAEGCPEGETLGSAEGMAEGELLGLFVGCTKK